MTNKNNIINFSTGKPFLSMPTPADDNKVLILVGYTIKIVLNDNKQYEGKVEGIDAEKIILDVNTEDNSVLPHTFYTSNIKEIRVIKYSDDNYGISEYARNVSNIAEQVTLILKIHQKETNEKYSSKHINKSIELLETLVIKQFTV